jgi:N-acetylmuramoyl-L-alanine amidase
MDIISAPSPNFRPRSTDVPWQESVQHLVLHYTELNLTDSLNRLRARESEVSCHYLVDEEGAVHQLVADRHVAFHAGLSFWRGVKNLNATSIGIELVNMGHAAALPAYQPEQLASLIQLCRQLIDRYSIPAVNIVGHSDIAPSRKLDPGEHFPWLLLAEAGIGLWPMLEEGELEEGAARAGEPDPDPAATYLAVQQNLRQIGYELGAQQGGAGGAQGLREGSADGAAQGFEDRSEDGADPLALPLLAFQRRWLPHHLNGQPDALTRRRLAQVAGVY